MTRPISRKLRAIVGAARYPRAIATGFDFSVTDAGGGSRACLLKD
jgi:hypothetical protein